MSTKLGGIATGASAGIKGDAKPADKVIAAEEQKAIEEAITKAADLKPGQIVYTKLGYPVFNCVSKVTAQKIAFEGGSYFREADDPVKEELEETLDFFVNKGIITKKVGEAE
jgi:hypothetical protein